MYSYKKVIVLRDMQVHIYTKGPHIWNLPQIPPRLWRFTRVNARTSQSVQLPNGIATCFVNCFKFFEIAYALNTIAAAQYISTATLCHILSIKFDFLHSYRVQKRYMIIQIRPRCQERCRTKLSYTANVCLCHPIKLQSISTLNGMLQLTVTYPLRLKYCNSWKSWNQNELSHWKPLEVHIIVIRTWRLPWAAWSWKETKLQMNEQVITLLTFSQPAPPEFAFRSSSFISLFVMPPVILLCSCTLRLGTCMAHVLLHINKPTGMETTTTSMHDDNIAMGPLSLYIVWGYRINDNSYILELAQSSVLFEGL